MNPMSSKQQKSGLKHVNESQPAVLIIVTRIYHYLDALKTSFLRNRTTKKNTIMAERIPKDEMMVMIRPGAEEKAGLSERLGGESGGGY